MRRSLPKGPAPVSRRLCAMGLALASLVPVLVGTVGAAGVAQPAPLAGRETVVAAGSTDATDAHPYSDPIFYPVRQPMQMDCFRRNPGCKTHAEYQLDLVTTTTRRQYNDHVYAMGAGRVVSKYTRGAECKPGGDKTIGSYLVIDHGGGVTSTYARLSGFAPHLGEGDLVDAGQYIGVLGNTGAVGTCNHPYLDFWVAKGKTGKGTPKLIEITSLQVCIGSFVQTWPSGQYSRFTSWNDVPKEKPFPATGHPLEVPDGSCLPKGEPATPHRPATPSLVRDGSGRLRASWKGQPEGTGSMAELQIWRAKIHAWVPEEQAYLGGNDSHYVFRDLTDGLDARLQLSYHNRFGWSRATPYVTRKIGAPPGAPISRGLSTDTRHDKAFARLKWKPGARHGFDYTGFTVEIRKGDGDWTATNLSSRTFTYRFDDLSQKTEYQVRVKARSAVGDSDYLTKRFTTPKK